MSAQPAARADERGNDELLDVDTSAAILRWMETALVPEGINPDRWHQWIEGGCRGRIEAGGVPVTAAMLGRWGRTGALR